MSMELKYNLKNIVDLVKLQLRKNYRLIWILLLSSVILCVLELVKVFSWDVVQNPDYAIELGEYTGAYLCFLLPAVIMYQARNILTDSGISMYPGTTQTRFWSRIISDCIMLSLISLCICIEAILQYVLLLLFNAMGITGVILPFSWGYLLHHFIAQTIFTITIYSVFVAAWTLIARIPIRVATALSCVLLLGLCIVFMHGVLGINTVGDLLSELFAVLKDSFQTGVMPSGAFVLRNICIIFVFLAIATLITGRNTICQETPAKNTISAIFGILLLLHISTGFIISVGTIYDTGKYPTDYYEMSSVKREFVFEEDNQKVKNPVIHRNITTIPSVENPGANDSMSPYLSGEELEIHPEYYTASAPWGKTSQDMEEKVRMYIVGPEWKLDGAGYIYQEWIDEMDVNIEKASMQITLPTSPVAFNTAFGNKYYSRTEGDWKEFMNWVYAGEGNPFYMMSFIVQGTQEIQE